MDNVCLPSNVEAHEKKQHEAQQKKSDSPTAPPKAPEPAPAPAAESSEQILHLGSMDSMDEDNYALTFCTLTEVRKPRTVLDKVIEQSQATKMIPNRLIPLALTCKGGKEEIDYDTVLSQSKGTINKHWLLLDNQSKVNVISNGDLLTNIRQIDQYMHIYCNSGKASTNRVEDLDGVGTVWFHKNGIANIL